MSDLTRLNGEWMLCEDHQAEVERLTQHVKERERVWTERERVAIKEVERLHGVGGDYLTALEEASAEVERLREAIEFLLPGLDEAWMLSDEGILALRYVQDALAGEGGEDG